MNPEVTDTTELDRLLHNFKWKSRDVAALEDEAADAIEERNELRSIFATRSVIR